MPLTQTQLEHFKKKLEVLHAQMTKTLQRSSDEVTKPDEATGYSQHQADQGTDDFDRTISLGLTANELETLKQIERALEKIEDGTYGICVLSDAEIPIKRLEAMPYALMTVDAQSRLEKGLI
jgi:DnaK suppressor protein